VRNTKSKEELQHSGTPKTMKTVTCRTGGERGSQPVSDGSLWEVDGIKLCCLCEEILICSSRMNGGDEDVTGARDVTTQEPGILAADL